MDLRLKYPPVPEQVANLAGLCVDAARRVSKIDLDYSPESLRLVDEQLTTLGAALFRRTELIGRQNGEHD